MAVMYMFLLTLGFACVYMYGLAQMEFTSQRIAYEKQVSKKFSVLKIQFPYEKALQNSILGKKHPK